MLARQEPSLDRVIERAVVYVESFERDFAAVVAEEQLEQRASTSGFRIPLDARDRIFSLSGCRVVRNGCRFEMSSRSTASAVRDRNERLQKLFLDAPARALTDAARMTSESSRYNIGSVIRTINVPTFALMLLRPGYLKRFEFRKRSDEMIRRRDGLARRVRRTW